MQWGTIDFNKLIISLNLLNSKFFGSIGEPQVNEYDQYLIKYFQKKMGFAKFAYLIFFFYVCSQQIWSNQTNCHVALEKFKKIWTVSYSFSCTSCKVLVQNSYFKFQAKKLLNPSYILGMSSCLLHGWPGTIWQLYAVIPLHFTPLMLHYTLHSSLVDYLAQVMYGRNNLRQFYCIFYLAWDFPASYQVWVWIFCTHSCLDCLSWHVRMVY